MNASKLLKGKTKRAVAIRAIGAILSLTIILILAFIGAEGISEYAREGLYLSVRCVIPSMLPFLIVSDLYLCYGYPERITPLAKFMSLISGAPKIALRPIACGWLCGFPIGMKITCELYRAGVLSRREAERISAISNTPSPAFVISAVGLGMYGSRWHGIILFVCVLLSSIMFSLITRKRDRTAVSSFIFEQSYDFISSVKQAGLNCISVSSFIIIFSVVTGLIESVLGSELFSGLFACILEVTNATRILTLSACFDGALGFSLSAFALGFGGLSVTMQSAIFTKNTDLKLRIYIVYKLAIGVLSALLALCSYFLFLN